MIPLYTAGIEWFHCIQKCPHFRGGWNREVLLHTEVSSFQGVGIKWFHCTQRNRGVPLYTEVSSFQGGVGIERFYCIQRCPHFRGLE